MVTMDYVKTIVPSRSPCFPETRRDGAGASPDIRWNAAEW